MASSATSYLSSLHCRVHPGKRSGVFAKDLGDTTPFFGRDGSGRHQDVLLEYLSSVPMFALILGGASFFTVIYSLVGRFRRCLWLAFWASQPVACD